MLINNLDNTIINNWIDVKKPTEDEIKANRAPITFFAETSLSEKIQRVFNDAMFVISGAKCLTLIPGLTAGLKFGGVIAGLSSTSLMQIPLIATIAAFAPKVIILLAFTVVIRKILAVAICYIVYPATLMNKKELDSVRSMMFDKLIQQQYECRRIALNKSGIDYDAFAIEHKTTKNNKQWVIVAGGNGWVGEWCIENCAKQFSPLGFNVLYVNGPGVGRSSGFPTTYAIGAAQEAGLQFLEKSVDAKTILLYGTSLGGGAQAEAILNHSEFKKEINYMVWSHVTFDKLSHAASSMVTHLANPLFFLLGIELDGIAGGQKLKELGIRHIITQNSQAKGNWEICEKGTDGVIPNIASLHVGLNKAGVYDIGRMKFHLDPAMPHNGALSLKIMEKVNEDIKYYIDNPLPR